jgi:hypothetical protein
MLEFVPAEIATTSTLEFISGDSRLTLPKFVEEHQVDYFFHDSDHSIEHMYFEYNTVAPKLSIGGLFTSHDIMCKDVWQTFMKENPNYKQIYQWHTGVAERMW